MPSVATELSPQMPPINWQAEFTDAVTDLAVHGDTLYASSADGKIYHFDLAGKLLADWQAHNGGVIRVGPQPNGNKVASSGEDGQVLLWSADGASCEVLAREPRWIEHLEWTANGATLAAAAERTIYLWRINPGDHESLGVWYDASRNVLAMAWAPDNKRLASACNKGLYLWRIGGDAPVELLQFPGAPVSVAWKQDSSALAVGTQDGFLQIWRKDPSGQSKQLTMRGYQGKVTCLSWHPRKKLIATAGSHDIVIWDLSSKQGGGKPTPLRRHQQTITRLAYSPSGHRLASGDRAGRLCIWNTETGLEYEWMVDAEVTAMQWSVDGQQLAVGNIFGQLRVFEIDQ